MVSIFAATNGFMDSISVKDVKRFEKEMLEYIEVNNKKLFEDIRVKKQLNDEIIENIKKIVSDFISKFKKSE